MDNLTSAFMSFKNNLKQQHQHVLRDSESNDDMNSSETNQYASSDFKMLQQLRSVKKQANGAEKIVMTPSHQREGYSSQQKINNMQQLGIQGISSLNKDRSPNMYLQNSYIQNN